MSISDRQLIPPGSYTATQTSLLQSRPPEPAAVGVLLFFNLTHVPSNADTVTVIVSGVDPVSGLSVPLFSHAFTGTAPLQCYGLLVYPGASDTQAALTGVNGVPVPATWKVAVVHSAASSWAYSLGATYC